ncbi:MAG TPA: hypothetical protein VGK74_01075 [Symbiobacteriaceae bacterium]
MLDVRIRVEGELFWYHHLPSVEMVVQEGTRLGALLFLLGIQQDDGVVEVNGRCADIEAILAQGDDIVVRPKDGSC